jgi:DNA-binding transcriptional MerR regulator
MDEIKARLKLTETLIQVMRQGLNLDDIKKILKLHMENKKAGE